MLNISRDLAKNTKVEFNDNYNLKNVNIPNIPKAWNCLKFSSQNKFMSLRGPHFMLTPPTGIYTSVNRSSLRFLMHWTHVLKRSWILYTRHDQTAALLHIECGSRRSRRNIIKIKFKHQNKYNLIFGSFFQFTI